MTLSLLREEPAIASLMKNLRLRNIEHFDALVGLPAIVYTAFCYQLEG